MAPEWSRRRLLALSAAGLTSVSGCSTIYGPGDFIEPDRRGTVREPPEGTPPGENSTDTERTTSTPPDKPAATLRTKDGDDTFSLHDLPPDNPEIPLYHRHPDSSAVRVAARDTMLYIYIGEMKLNRDITLKADYLQKDGSIGTTDAMRVSPESDDYQTYEWELPFNAKEAPRRTEAFVKLTVQDTHPGDDTKYTLKEHYFVAIPYQTATDSGIHYINHDSLNPTVTSGTVSSPKTPLFTDYIDTANERIRFFALTYPFDLEEPNILSAYSVIPHDDYREYDQNRTNTDWRQNHSYWTYMYNAKEFEYFTSLADSFAASLNAKGISDNFDRLQYLAYLIGGMRYHTDNIEDRQVWVLYNGMGDCSEMTLLYLAMMNLDVFGPTRGAGLHCRLRGVLHAVIGIDERDIAPPDPDSIHWVEPSQEMIDEGVPDTRYAFLEVTSPNDIGGFDPDKYEVYDVVGTTTLDESPDYREFGE